MDFWELEPLFPAVLKGDKQLRADLPVWEPRCLQRMPVLDQTVEICSISHEEKTKKRKRLMFITAVIISQWECVALFQIYSWDLRMSQGSACNPKDTLFACATHSINKKWKCQRSILKHSVIKQFPADLVLFGHYSPTSSPSMLWWAGDVQALLPDWEPKQRGKKKEGEKFFFESVCLKIKSCLQTAPAWQKEWWLSPISFCEQPLHWQPQTCSPTHQGTLMGHEIWVCFNDTFNFPSFTPVPDRHNS